MARRSRRRSNRSTAGLLIGLVLLLVLSGLAVNGIIKGASDSQSYLELVNRSFVTQSNVIVAHQQGQATELDRVLTRAPTMTRGELARSLEALMVSTQADATAAQNSLPPNPTGQLGQRFLAVIEQRAIAVHVIGLTIERLLGIAQQPGRPLPARARNLAARSPRRGRGVPRLQDFDRDGHRSQQRLRPRAAPP